ncbi:acyl carrier protein phosphodiesterase [Robertkochia aurantiaca]|uniref:acyl carrier protein phosphodiesterase n=1 Tax=Robertkochia aurantiaca TaxID=2873700 RepID=UPI001CCE2BCA|nr:acyl carrier protein phosphodiesterase [Robertkochia sp. 3YJGBD-33]
MNFLAHIYLSGDDPGITVGNFMADSIRGRKYLNYPEPIKNGILLHRAIDTYTDKHHVFRQSTKRLHANYSHYSGVIVDIYYDHFLAANWSRYSEIPLEEFAGSFYRLLQEYEDWLTSQAKRMMPYMIADDWLSSYAHLEGIEKVFQGLNRRTAYKSGMNHATEDLRAHYDLFEQEFFEFFEDLQAYSQEFRKNL